MDELNDEFDQEEKKDVKLLSGYSLFNKPGHPFEVFDSFKKEPQYKSDNRCVSYELNFINSKYPSDIYKLQGYHSPRNLNLYYSLVDTKIFAKLSVTDNRLEQHMESGWYGGDFDVKIEYNDIPFLDLIDKWKETVEFAKSLRDDKNFNSLLKYSRTKLKRVSELHVRNFKKTMFETSKFYELFTQTKIWW